MDPNNMMLAERLAQHFCQLRFPIALKYKKKYPTWETTPTTEKKIMIEVFAAILKMSGDIQLEENLQQRPQM